MKTARRILIFLLVLWTASWTALWIRTRHRAEALYLAKWDRGSLFVVFAHGSARFVWSSEGYPAQFAAPRRVTYTAPTWKEIETTLETCSPRTGGLAGAAWGRISIPSQNTTTFLETHQTWWLNETCAMEWLSIPDWMPLAPAIATALPMLFFGFRRKRRLSKKGYCPHCGYDLRATPNICPECGRAPSETAPHLRRWAMAMAGYLLLGGVVGAWFLFWPAAKNPAASLEGIWVTRDPVGDTVGQPNIYRLALDLKKDGAMDLYLGNIDEAMELIPNNPSAPWTIDGDQLMLGADQAPRVMILVAWRHEDQLVLCFVPTKGAKYVPLIRTASIATQPSPPFN